MINILNKFTDTVIYKDSSQMDDQIEALERLVKEYPDNKELSRRLKLIEIGNQGEKNVIFFLKNSNIGMYVLRDINIEIGDLKAQIDFVVITPGYVYFLECKKLVGNITINSKGEFLRKYDYRKDEAMLSPISQAERHIDVFFKKQVEVNNSLLDKIFRNNSKSWYIPLAVIASPKTCIKMNFTPKDIRNKIIRAEHLNYRITKDINYLKRKNKMISTKKEMESLAKKFKEVYHTERNINYYAEYKKEFKLDEIKKDDIEIIDINLDNNDIKEKLIEYRTNKSKELNYPAYYIFTNEELDKLLELMPKNIEELTINKILTPIKVKMYGEDIIKIVNR